MQARALSSAAKMGIGNVIAEDAEATGISAIHAQTLLSKA